MQKLRETTSNVNETVLDVKDLNKSFETVQAVKNVSLTIHRGEIVALLGPNGAGKTTTMRCITSLSRPDSYTSIKVLGKSVNGNKKFFRKSIGVCPQELNLYENSTAIENLRLQSYFLGLKKNNSEEAIQRLLVKVNLSDRQNELVKKYSGGMKRRLQITRSLIGNPVLLILDEPTVGLSPADRKEIWTQLFELRNQGVAILFTTHYMEEADILANRIYIMNNGEIIAEGSPEELKDRFRSKTIVQIESSDEKLVKVFQMNNISFETLENLYIIKNINGNIPQLLKVIEGHNIREITIKRPSLEDVFLELTGTIYDE